MKRFLLGALCIVSTIQVVFGQHSGGIIDSDYGSLTNISFCYTDICEDGDYTTYTLLLERSMDTYVTMGLSAGWGTCEVFDDNVSGWYSQNKTKTMNFFASTMQAGLQLPLRVGPVFTIVPNFKGIGFIDAGGGDASVDVGFRVGLEMAFKAGKQYFVFGGGLQRRFDVAHDFAASLVNFNVGLAF
ncbi:hypothetical protein D0T53_03860 [Dysgonomonas sp. 216]|uniref:hypothetical protein n=1 Tax=Dysgonomonas sp. 216 TaxID=2302934 RepID=UPI0013D5FBF4|nr:hypothetical protein [Dysgonomonas sp. 216]NDW18052.1 hypothetical protein [Dysgonomonas sp. 216]